MITQIGLVAGEIWDYLEHNDREAKMVDMIDALQKDRDLVLMSVGWLARESHIKVEGKAPDYTVRLTNVGGKNE
ncbi:winged helix-turn-helix domain-containing protein [Candidatus Omnitrophota bacterium]